MKRIQAATQAARRSKAAVHNQTSLTPIATAVGIMVLCTSVAAQAQQAEAPKKGEEVQTVYVQGIRAALQQSLNQKKNAESHVEVITAEDIGKMPDKNLSLIHI